MPLTDFKATTPQSKVVGNLFKGLATLDISNIEPFVSKDFKYRTFPKTDNLPDQSKAACLEKYGTVISLFTKMEVCIRNDRRARRLRPSVPTM